MNGGCRTGEVVDPVNLHFEGVHHIMPHNFKILIIKQMSDIFPATGKEIIQANYFLALLDKTLA